MHYQTPTTLWTPLVIRLATEGDRSALRRLAELDSARSLPGGVLIAKLGERLVAAISLADGREIADPFTPTAEILKLLRLRARQLKPPPAPRARFVTLRSKRIPLARSPRLLAR